ncbi:MAG: hypothetical protein QM729_12095 [Solirubrobacterales bacterium]
MGEEETSMDERTAEVLAAYEAALNEADKARREELVASAMSEDARVLAAHLPGAPALDRQAFADDCGVVQGWRPPGARLRRRGEVDGHHGWIRFAWEVSLPGGEVIEVGGARIEGVDVVELAADGRFRTVIMFQGLAPAGSAAA